MSQNETKSWEKPWTTEEMIGNASDWSLAGDAGLLKYLESFSERMLSRAKVTHERLDNLMDGVNEAKLSLSNVNNEFRGLHNTQFIESRVYEDDETLPVNEEPKKVEKAKPTDAERLEEVKKIVLSSLGIIDKYYEKVEVPASDSEDDTDGPSVVFRPVDPYINRPLPYLIGTPEWNRSWHVGLLESSSDSEHDNEPDQFSETESEHETKNITIPDSSDSDLDQDISKANIPNPVASSTFNSQNSKDLLDTSDEDEVNSVPSRVNSVNNNFLSELSSKLGKVENLPEPEVNTRPLKKPKSNIPGGLFSDEPPPLDDEDVDDDIFGDKNMNSGLFPSKRGLFDDLDEENDFWDIKKKDNKKSVLETQKIDEVDSESVKDDLFSNIPKQNQMEVPKMTETKKPISDGLFDDEDDDIFTTSLLKQPPKPLIFNPYNTTTAPLISDLPPDLEPSDVMKPIEQTQPKASPILKNSLTAQVSKILRNPPPSSSESDNEPEILNKNAKTQQNPDKNLFESKSLFSDDLFAPNKKITSGLFDTEPPPLYDPPKTSDVKPSKIESLFDDDEDDGNYDDLFLNKPKQNSTKVTKPVKSSGLFSDNEEDLFATTVSKIENSESKTKTVNLFDASPPELNVSEAKSEGQRTQATVDYSAPSSLFDNMPQNTVESGIVRDQSTRYESEDTSFFPGASSSRRLSTDIFHDEQKNDSLFITKTKSNIDSHFVKTDLNSISEISSKTEITSSGREQSLYEDSTQEVSKSKDSKSEDTDIFKTKTEPNKPKTEEKPKSLFDDYEDIFQSVKPPKTKNSALFNHSDSEDDLFSHSSGSRKSNTSDMFPNVSKTAKAMKQKDIFQDDLFGESNTPNDLFANNINESIKTNSKSNDLFYNELNKETKAASNVNDNKLMTKELIDDTNDEKDVKIPETGTKCEQNLIKEEYKGPSPQKLKHNLNINVAALLPGSSPPKKNADKKVTSPVEEKTGENLLEGTSDKKLSVEKRESEPNVIEKTESATPQQIEEKKDSINTETISETVSPRKLQHNLNINVAALLPGAAPPRKHIEKSVSLDSDKSSENLDVKPFNNRPKSEIISDTRPALEKSISFDTPIDSTDILTSAVKERVKIAAKRKPSTRKGRQEAIRKSGIDFVIDDPIFGITNTVSSKNVNIDSAQENQIDSQNILNNNLNDPNTRKENLNIKFPANETENKPKDTSLFSPSTDEEDQFSIPRDLSDTSEENALFGKTHIYSPVDKKEIVKDKIENTENLFATPNEMGDNLLGASVTKNTDSKFDDLFPYDTKVTKKITEMKKPKPDTSLFSSSDSESDLFEVSKSDKKVETKTIMTLNQKDDLFDDDNDEFIVPSKTAQKETKTAVNTQSSKDFKEIFGDDDDEFTFTKKTVSKPNETKSLFEDDDDLDDIFGNSSHSIKTKRNTVQANIVKKPPTLTKTVPFTSDDDTGDPLDVLKNK